MGWLVELSKWIFDRSAKMFGWGVISDYDRRLFEKLLTTLPSNGSVKFVDEYDFLFGDFHESEIEQIRDFVSGWNSAEHEFKDKKLERIRKELYERLDKFMGVLVTTTVPVGDGTELSIFPSNQPRKDGEGRYLPQFREDARKTNEAARGILDIHQKLVREGRKRLRL